MDTRVLILYKTTDQAKRRKIAAKLKDYGIEIISGVYECRIKFHILENLKSFFESFAYEDGDFVRIYHISGEHEIAAWGERGEERAVGEWTLI